MPAARFRNAALIYNPVSGRFRAGRQREIERAAALLEGQGIRCECATTTGLGSATALARRAVADARDLVIACGGDGTVNEVVNGMAQSAVPLAILPAGTGNAAATAIGLPWSIRRAAALIPHGVVRRIALGQAGERYFMCLAGAGADGHLVQRANRRLGQVRFKILRYVLEGYRQLWLYDFPLFDVHIGNTVLPATQVLCGRLKYFLLPITPHADLFGDDFEVVVVTTRSPLRLFFSSLAIFTRTLQYFPGVRYLRARELRAVPRSGRVLAQTDAEEAGELPLEFRVVPDALSLVVPEKLARQRQWTT